MPIAAPIIKKAGMIDIKLSFFFVILNTYQFF
jgi:hypothetical protein